MTAKEQNISQIEQQLQEEKNSLKQESIKNKTLLSEVSDRDGQIKQLNEQLKQQVTSYESLNQEGIKQTNLIDELRSQLAEQKSLLSKKEASGTYKTWTIVFLGILLTISSVLSARSFF